MFPFKPTDLAHYKQRTVSCHAFQPNFAGVGYIILWSESLNINARTKGKFEESDHISHLSSPLPTNKTLMEKDSKALDYKEKFTMKKKIILKV